MAVAVAALIVSGISALISYRVYAANQESNRKTQESNRLAQRAFVTVQNPALPSAITRLKTMELGIQ